MFFVPDGVGREAGANDEALAPLPVPPLASITDGTGLISTNLSIIEKGPTTLVDRSLLQDH